MKGTCPIKTLKAYFLTMDSIVPTNSSAWLVSLRSMFSETMHSITNPLGFLPTVGFCRRHHLNSFTSGLNLPPLTAFLSVVHKVCRGGLVSLHSFGFRSGK